MKADGDARTDSQPEARTRSQGIGRGSLAGPALVPWLLLAIPVAWGLYKALLSAAKILQ